MKETIQFLWKFEINADEDEFIKIFGTDSTKGTHLFKKFVEYDHSILKLWGYLDLENRQKLSEYLKEKKILEDL